jgi:porin
MSRWWVAFATLLALLAVAPQARAQHDGYVDFWHRDTLTGNWDGLRDELADQGITFSMTYTAELWGNVSGGIKRGAAYDGALLPEIDVDLEKLVGWTGASFSASMLQGHGPSIATGWVGNLMGASGTAVIPPATRLFDLWVQQNLFGDVLSIRAGVMNVDAEFMTNVTGSTFLNTTFGWSAWVGSDLPGGGPAYPLSAPGVRVRVKPPIDNTYIQAAVFSGDPTGHNGSNSLSTSIPTGTVISFSGGVFTIVEAGYAVNQEKGAKGPPEAFKLGGWYHSSNHFQDQRFATDGLSLADPLSTGVPLNHHGDWGIYASADGTFYQTADGNNLSGFARIGTATPNDRNLISFYADAGLTYSGLIPTRDDDTVGIAVGFARIGANARGLDQDTQFFTGNPLYPVRSQEVVMEVTYQAQVTPWLTVQPDFQYVFNPDGGVLNPNGSRRGNAVVLGVRSVITF